ncbi:MAG TPA: hypothetical protein VFA46_17900 [Actinomycetes bacterium]|nr:hypothetical protein [Actinomycetes bacterium]
MSGGSVANGLLACFYANVQKAGFAAASVDEAVILPLIRTVSTRAYGGIPVVRELQRANALLYRQSTALRTRSTLERFQAWEQARAAGTPPPRWARFGVLSGPATTMEPTEEWASVRPEHGEWREPLVNVHTSLGEFPVEVCTRLVYRGWWLAGATLSRFHRQPLPEALPAWRELGP